MNTFQTRHAVDNPQLTKPSDDQTDKQPPAPPPSPMTEKRAAPPAPPTQLFPLPQVIGRTLTRNALSKNLLEALPLVPENDLLERGLNDKTRMMLKIVHQRAADADAVIPEITRREFIGQIRNHNALSRLGARHVTGVVGKDALPTEDTAPTVFWRDETGSTTKEFEVADFKSTVRQAKSVCFQIQVPRILWRNHPQRLNTYLFEMGVQHFGGALQTAAITGTGANDEPLGLLAAAAAANSQVQAENLSGGITTAKLLNMLEKLADVESSMLSNEVGFVANPTTLKVLRDLTTAGGNDVIQALGSPARLHLLGYPVESVKAVPDGTVILGDWANGLEFLHWNPVLDLLVNPFTRSQRVKILATSFVNLAIKREPFFVVGQ